MSWLKASYLFIVLLMNLASVIWLILVPSVFLAVHSKGLTLDPIALMSHVLESGFFLPWFVDHLFIFIKGFTIFLSHSNRLL